ncbi:hypothetical protein Z045_24880 [Rhodococcus pyridinivorans KG-16]|uniref:Uncharacterized protein n=1 Tax=Rhodococcus pyridinivorans KG-16 TaxID=1441730 RepID=A0A0V9UDH9_9NOCA|nr:hypothetical protein Z045_24880 [Rhodococcus pyridinivorans KG-16]
MFMGVGALACAGLGDIVGTGDRVEATHAVAVGAGAHEVAPAVDDLIAGLTAVDELPPAADRHADTYEGPVLVVTVPLATDRSDLDGLPGWSG